MNEIFESIALAEELWLWFQEHFLSEGLQNLLAYVPIEDVHYPGLLLRVELICFLQVVDECHLIYYFGALRLVELLCLLDELLIEVYSREEPIICQLSSAQLDVYFDDVPQLFVRCLQNLLSKSLFLDLAANSSGQLVALRIEHNFLKDLVALVIQRCDRMHFNIKSIEILKELLHPVDHDLVISPSLVQRYEKLGTTLSLQIIDHVLVEVVFDGLGVLAIQYALGLLELERTEIEHDRVVLHVFLFGEHDVVVASEQEALKLIYRSFFYDLESFLDHLLDRTWLEYLCGSLFHF